MSEWKTYKLSELVEIKYGQDHKHLAEGDIPLYGSGGIMRYIDAPLYKQKSVQSALRRNIQRIYLPDLQEKAVETVIPQAKMLAEDLVNGNDNE